MFAVRGSSWTSSMANVASRSSGTVASRPLVTHAASTTRAPTSTVRATAGRGRRRRRPEASRAPSRPPTTPPTIAMSVPSTRMSLLHDSVWVNWVQPHSVAWPTVPMATPATAPNTRGRRGERDREGEQLDDDRRAEVQREGRQDLAEARADDQRDAAADDEEEGGRRERAAAAHEQPGGDQGEARGAGDHQRLEDQPELRDVEVVLALEDRQPEQQAAHRRGLPDEARGLPDLAVAVVGGQAAVALLLEDQQADDRQPGAGDEHQVGRAPERDVLAEEAVPDVVQREAEQRVEAGAGEQDAADRHVPAAEEADGGRAGLLVQRHRAGEHAAGEDAEEAEQDQEVRGVGQRALVAADADVQRDVPEHPEQRDQQGDRREDGRQRHPGRHAGRLAEAVADPGEDRGPAGAVQEDEPEQQRRSGRGRSRSRGSPRRSRRLRQDVCQQRAARNPLWPCRLWNTHHRDIAN